jgi:hypothetical protein
MFGNLFSQETPAPITDGVPVHDAPRNVAAPASSDEMAKRRAMMMSQALRTRPMPYGEQRGRVFVSNGPGAALGNMANAFVNRGG